MVKIGWKAGPEQYPPMELLSYAVAAEQAGFETIDTSDHIQPWSDEGQATFTWAWFGALAVSTQRIEFGTGLTCPILRYHPSVIAQAGATVGAMAPGRFYISVGTGEALNEYAATGEWPGYDERQERMGEAIQLIRELWKGQPVSWRGKYYRTEKLRIYTLPPKPVPIYVSAMVADSATFAGEHGDGLLTVGGQKPDLYKQMLENFAQGAKKAGKDPSTMPKLIELNVGIAGDQAGQQAEMSEFMTYWAGTLVPALYDQKIYTPAMSAQNGEVVGPEVVKQKGCFSANPDDHVAFLRKHIDLGFTHLYLHYAGPDQGRFLEWYGREVLPRVKSQSDSQGESQSASQESRSGQRPAPALR